MAAVSPADNVAALAAEIRNLKAELTASGLKSAEINRHPEVTAKVAALKDLKSTLAHDDPSRDEAFFARQQAEKEEADRREQALAKSQREELSAVEAKVRRPLVQRKIFHLFQFAGSGPNFHYEPPPRLNAAQCGFGDGARPHPAVYVTEKWDGTTMQATSTCILKRLDLRAGKRSKLDPADRYDLKLIAWRSQDIGGKWHGLDFIDADERVAEAVTPHLSKLEAMADDLCVYFEVVHTDINTTFKHIPGFADIRVFDFSRMPSSEAAQGQFLPFEETIALAKDLRFPLVGWCHHAQLDAAEVWAQLHEAKTQKYDGVPAPLEGFVVREAGRGERIAKARVEHLHTSDSPGQSSAIAQDAARNVAALAEARAALLRYDRRQFYLDQDYLAKLGLWHGGAAYTLRSAGDDLTR